jgi:hypothetical protein
MCSLEAAAEDFINAIHAYLQECVEAEKTKCGVVVGLVDEKRQQRGQLWEAG